MSVKISRVLKGSKGLLLAVKLLVEGVVTLKQGEV